MMDLEQHILRQMAWSRATFGPQERLQGVIDHITKELLEIENAPNRFARPSEWVDVVILALDGLWRSIEHNTPNGVPKPRVVAQELVERLLQKQEVNEHRNWPDWRTGSEHRAIEHVRS